MDSADLTKMFGKKNKPFFVAEISSNHNGNFTPNFNLGIVDRFNDPLANISSSKLSELTSDLEMSINVSDITDGLYMILINIVLKTC